MVRGWRLKVVAVAALTIAALSSYYYYTLMVPAEATLVIYTYNSLLKYGMDPEDAYDKVFLAFGREHNVEIVVKNFSDTGALLPALLSEKNDPVADVVIGLTPVMVQQAKENELLEQYTPSGIEAIPSYLIEGLDPEHYAIPYEYGMIALVYDSVHVNPSTHPRIVNITYADFYDSAYSETLILENPTTSAPGLDFLLGQIAFYREVLDEDWRIWWRNIKDHARITPNWDEAFGLFASGEGGYHMLVSYATDSAYSAYFNYPMYNTTLMHHGDETYGWLQILGIGIVRDAKHSDTAKEFVEWFIGETVQSEIPLNEWMYPANSDVTLPEVFDYALDVSDVVVMNTYITPDDMAENLTTWLQEWQMIFQD